MRDAIVLSNQWDIEPSQELLFGNLKNNTRQYKLVTEGVPVWCLSHLKRMNLIERERFKLGL